MTPICKAPKLCGVNYRNENHVDETERATVSLGGSTHADEISEQVLKYIERYFWTSNERE